MFLFLSVRSLVRPELKARLQNLPPKPRDQNRKEKISVPAVAADPPAPTQRPRSLPSASRRLVRLSAVLIIIITIVIIIIPNDRLVTHQ